MGYSGERELRERASDCRDVCVAVCAGGRKHLGRFRGASAHTQNKVFGVCHGERGSGSPERGVRGQQVWPVSVMRRWDFTFQYGGKAGR